MSEEPTQNLPQDGVRQILARLDSIDSRLDSMDSRLDTMDSRLQALESQAERRAIETKPIWERALAELLELRRGVENVERKIDVLSRDIVQVRADQSHADARLTRLESESLQKS